LSFYQVKVGEELNTLRAFLLSMKKKKEMWSSTIWQYTLTIDIGEKEKEGVVDARGPTRRILTQVFHKIFDDPRICITFIPNYIA
jgi:hypothetical protein